MEDLIDRLALECEEFPDLFKSELGCLNDFELEVKLLNQSSSSIVLYLT